MLRGLSKIKILFVLSVLWAFCFYAGCEKDSDGPINVTNGDVDFDGEGFFRGAKIDSGRTIHLVGDTLFLELSKIWSFSNCALRSIDCPFDRRDSVLWIKPKIDIHVSDEDCAAPYFRPDTLLKLFPANEDFKSIGKLYVKDDKDSILDSVLIRRGKIQKDTFFIYMDSAFSDPHRLPLRTKAVRTKGKKSDSIPTIIRVLDSLTPRVFYWRTMKSVCTHRIDMCNDIVADTIYPTSWKIADTNLVPIRYACANADSVYCINSKWKNDSTALGKLQERPDTIWHQSTYYVEKIPKCGTFNSFNMVYYGVGQRVRFIRELFSPDSSETFCGPATGERWNVYNLSNSKMDVDSLSRLDSLIAQWKKAEVAPDTLIVDSTDSKK